MDFLQILQTIGICMGSLALVAIAIMMFMVLSVLGPPPDDFSEELSEEDEILDSLKGLSREQIKTILETQVPIDENPPRRKSSRRKK